MPSYDADDDSPASQAGHFRRECEILATEIVGTPEEARKLSLTALANDLGTTLMNGERVAVERKHGKLEIEINAQAEGGPA